MGPKVARNSQKNGSIKNHSKFVRLYWLMPTLNHQKVEMESADGRTLLVKI